MRSYLEKIFARGMIPNSFLFAGPTDSSKEEVLFEFVNKLLEQQKSPHPDLYQFFPEGKIGLHSVESLRILKEEIYLPPFQATRKIFILHEADRMNLVSANALLKCFEEPLPTSFIFLLSAHPERILSTIRSRCHALYFKSEKQVKQDIFSLIPLLKALSITPLPIVFEKLQEYSTHIEKSSEVAMEASEEDLSAFQKQSREKEKEGKEALREARLFEASLQGILGWYRDLALLRVNGDQRNLMHPLALAELKERLELGIYPSLDHITKGIDQARRMYERSIPLKNIYETLFILLKNLEQKEVLNCLSG